MICFLGKYKMNRCYINSDLMFCSYGAKLSIISRRFKTFIDSSPPYRSAFRPRDRQQSRRSLLFSLFLFCSLSSMSNIYRICFPHKKMYKLIRIHNHSLSRRVWRTESATLFSHFSIFFLLFLSGS